MTSRKRNNQPTIYTLTDFKEGSVFCVCTSMEKLKEAVGYWMNERPLTTMSYLEWEPNKVEEPISWDWAYISPLSNRDDLIEGGAWDPPKDIWGINLLEIDTMPYYNAWHDEMMREIYAETSAHL